MMEDKKLEILYDHYKDTFENIKIYLQRRNYFTIIILVMVMILSFQISNPDKTSEITNEIVKKNIGNVSIDFKYITSVLLFALFWVVIMYYQIIFVIEKHYSYIHELEEKLKPLELQREGKNYLNHFPLLSCLVDKIYTILFPSALILVAITKWITEKNNLNCNYQIWNFWIDTIILLGIVVTSLLYLSYRHFNDFKKKENQSPAAN
jgi:hypothetical protein